MENTTVKKKLIYISALIAVFLLGIGLGVYIRSQTLNPKATFPNFLERTFSFFISRGVKDDDDLLYFDTDLSDFIINGSKRTKVAVIGTVSQISKQPDGDYHIIISSPHGLFLVTEAIPEIKLPLPKVEDKIKIWGIVRFDEFHNWWEIHPVIGWEKTK